MTIGQNIQSSGPYLVLGASGSGVYLRPWGVSEDAGQAYQGTDGYFTSPGIRSTNIQSNGVSLLLGAAGDAVYLRPYGIGNGTNQAYLRTDGYFITPLLSVSGYAGFGSNVDIAGSFSAGGNITAAAGLRSNGGSIYVRGSNSHVWFEDGGGTTRGVVYFEVGSDQLKFQNQSGSGGNSLALAGDGKIYASRGIASRDGYSGGYGSVVYNLRWDSGSWYLKADDLGIGYIAVTSDYRTKKDVVDLQGTWDTVKALRPIKYTQANFGPNPAGDMSRESNPLFVEDDIERWGFIAHELQETMTMSAATAHKDAPNDIQSPNPWTIIAALTKTVQELQARVEALEGK